MRKLVAMAALVLAACNGQASDEAASVPGELLNSDPDVGAFGTLTSGMARDAADLVTEGRVYRLGLVTGPDTPVYGDRGFAMETFELGRFGPNNITANDDKVTTHLGIGTQIDGLGHIGVDGVHYNGVPVSEVLTPDGLTRYGTQDLPAVVTRGVMIDMAAHFGVETMEPLGQFGAEDIQAAAEEQGVEVHAGDVVLFNTGWLSEMGDAETFISQAPGINADGAAWLVEQGVVAVGADNAALETSAPAEDGSVLPVHAMLIAEHGIFILEGIDTRELAQDGVHEFMFVLGAPRLQGSVQAIINPVAIR